jgi:hypothetical protein
VIIGPSLLVSIDLFGNCAGAWFAYKSGQLLTSLTV